MCYKSNKHRQLIWYYSRHRHAIFYTSHTHPPRLLPTHLLFPAHTTHLHRPFHHNPRKRRTILPPPSSQYPQQPRPYTCSHQRPSNRTHHRSCRNLHVRHSGRRLHDLLATYSPRDLFLRPSHPRTSANCSLLEYAPHAVPHWLRRAQLHLPSSRKHIVDHARQ